MPRIDAIVPKTPLEIEMPLFRLQNAA